MVFGDEGEVAGANFQQQLLVFVDFAGHWNGAAIGAHFGAIVFWVDEGFYVKRDAIGLQGLYGFGVNDRCTVIGQFDGIVVGEFWDEHRIVEFFGIGVHHTGHVFPNGDGFGAHDAAKYRRAVIRPFSAQSGGFSWKTFAYKSLRNDQVFLGDGQQTIFDHCFRFFPLNACIAVSRIGENEVARINPLVCYFLW